METKKRVSRRTGRKPGSSAARIFLASLFLALGFGAAVWYGQTETAYAHYTGTVEMKVDHAKDCPCGSPELGSYYFIPGSEHKFQTSVLQLSNSVKIDRVIGLKYEWNAKKGVSLVKTEGDAVWVKIESGDQDSFSVELAFSYTGYVSEGVEYQEVESGLSSGGGEVRKEFYLVTEQCNPKIEIQEGKSQTLKVYAKHFTVADPYGKDVKEITSWIDWSKADVRCSTVGGKDVVELTSNGVLKAIGGIKKSEDFRVSIFQAVYKSDKVPSGTVCWVIGDPVRGAVAKKPVAVKDTVTQGSLVYTVTKTGKSRAVALTGVKNAPASLVIPDTIKIGDESYQVTAISGGVCKNAKALRSVSIGKYVASIGNGAFYGCSALSSVNGCANVQTIGKQAFSGCKKLSAVKGCAKAATVGEKAFFNCTKLKTVGNSNGSVSLASVKSIGASAFSGCKSLKKVNLTSGVLTKIGNGAFASCTSLTSFTAKSTKLSTIGKQAFYGDKKLGAISLKTSKLTKGKMGANAFRGIKASCKFKVPSKKVSSYKAMFKAKGAGKKIKVTKL